MKGKYLGASSITSRLVTWWACLLLITRSEVGVVGPDNLVIQCGCVLSSSDDA